MSSLLVIDAYNFLNISGTLVCDVLAGKWNTCDVLHVNICRAEVDSNYALNFLITSKIGCIQNLPIQCPWFFLRACWGVSLQCWQRLMYRCLRKQLSLYRIRTGAIHYAWFDNRATSWCGIIDPVSYVSQSYTYNHCVCEVDASVLDLCELILWVKGVQWNQ